MSTETEGRRSITAAALAPLAVGLLALVVGTAFGWDARLVDAIVTPPPLVRAALAGLAAAVGVALLAASLRRLGAEHDRIAGEPPDMPTMVRGIRLAFLAVAAFAAAVGWLIGNPLPIVIALVIAGVDVIETSFLLLVVTVRRR